MGTWTKIWIESVFFCQGHTHTHTFDKGETQQKLFLFSCDQKLYKTMKPFAGCLLENIHLSDSLKDRLGFLFLWRGLKHGLDLFEAMKQWRCPSVLQFCPSGFLLGSLFFGGFQVGGRTWRYTSVSDTPETPFNPADCYLTITPTLSIVTPKEPWHQSPLRTMQLRKWSNWRVSLAERLGFKATTHRFHQPIQQMI